MPVRRREKFMDSQDIVFIANSLAKGGAERVMSVLASSFASQGRKVSMLVFRPHPHEYPVDSSVEIRYGPQGNSIRAKIRRIMRIRKIVKSNRNATVIAFEYFVNIHSLIACFGLPNQVIVSERNDPAQVGNRFPIGLVRNIAYRTANMVVCQTQDAADYFSDRITKTVILNPVKPGMPEPSSGPRRKVVVTFCRLEPQKNLPMLIRAFSVFREAHPEYTLEIYGEGSQRNALQSLTNSLSLGESVKILPPTLDIHDLVRDCMMFVLPSDYEGLSNSMLESMVLGLPVICTDCPCGGARMVITNERNGLLVPVGDVDALSVAMQRIADDEVFAENLGRAATTIRTRVSAEAIASEWNELIQNTT